MLNKKTVNVYSNCITKGKGVFLPKHSAETDVFAKNNRSGIFLHGKVQGIRDGLK